MHDQLFAYGSAMNDDTFVTAAKKIGLDTERFSQDIDSAEVAAKVAADKAEGERIGINGTPYFIINRHPFHGSYSDLKKKL